MPTRETFERHLQQLQDELLVLGSMAEQAIMEAMESLKKRDLDASHRIFSGDRKINEKRYAIENGVLTLIATQQPMARDLRLLAAILEINTELERIGDYAKGIARINLLLPPDYPLPLPIADLELMTQKGLDMLHKALGAFIQRDAELARQIPNEDDVVDDLYNHVYKELMRQMIANPSLINYTNYLVWAAHNLERMADRVTNICERIVFVVTGEMRELDVRAGEEMK